MLSILLILATMAPATIEAPPLRVERYEYIAVPHGSEDPERREMHRTTITTTESGIRYEYRRMEKDQTENGWIETDSAAAFQTAFRVLEKDGKGIAEEDSLWRDGERLLVRRRKPRDDDKEQMKEFDLPDDKPLAVDASLLLWMRTFPFDDDTRIKVYMVDFSQRDVTVRVQQKGVETVTVPAGSFECYHLEVVVKKLILKATIHFWVTTDEPHFLVRHKGKRGPFTSTYDTELVRIGEFTE